jgi:hypothetical protein
MTERVEEQHVEIRELGPALGRDLAVIGQIGAIAETKTEGGTFTMADPNR